MTKSIPALLLIVSTLAACATTSSDEQRVSGPTQCTQLGAQAQSLMVGSSDNPVRCGPQDETLFSASATIAQPQIAAVQTVASAAPQSVTVQQPLVVIPNTTGPVVPGQMTQAEAEFLASEGVPATQENIDFIRLAVQ